MKRKVSYKKLYEACKMENEILKGLLDDTLEKNGNAKFVVEFNAPKASPEEISRCPIPQKLK